MMYASLLKLGLKFSNPIELQSCARCLEGRDLILPAAPEYVHVGAPQGAVEDAVDERVDGGVGTHHQTHHHVHPHWHLQHNMQAFG